MHMIEMYCRFNILKKIKHNMGAFNPYLLKVVLFCILAVGFAKSEHTCKRGCSKSDIGILKYRPGNVYEYSFDSSLTVGFGTNDPDNTSLKLMGSLKVFAEDNCGYTLQISSVKVSTAKEAIEKKLVQNIQKPVYFVLVNGKLESQLCSDTSDSQYSLNIKRALISLFQSNTDDATETDVFGQCLTHTSISKSGEEQVLTKVRDLSKCAYRENTRSGLIHGIVNQAAGFKLSHLFKASSIKESKISNGVVEQVHLVEDYTFDLTEKSKHSVRGKIVTNLKVRNTDGIPAPAPQTGTHGSSIIFQKPEPYRIKNLSALKTLLAQLVDLLKGYVKKNSAKEFTELIRLMRNADTDTLLELAGMPHENSALTRKVYMDALFRTGTAESVKAILKQINKMDEQEKRIAIISLNFAQTVDKETLNQVAMLLVPNAPKQVYLSIGSLVAKYCTMNGCELGDLDAILKKFVDNLRHCKASTKRDEDRIVNILKGMGNIRHLTSRSAAVLAECASSGRAIRIRVAALQAFGSTPCQSVLIEKALALLRDRNDDSEIRIEAYLAAIKCPSADLAVEIEKIVNSEPIYQVGGFIASSLQVIRDSTDYNREYQRYHLGNIRVTKRFPVNPKRYSSNTEVSYKLDAFGFSASSDHQLIYSQHGFLPRSAKLNVTSEFFGTNFNILEASVRQENLENILEYYVGPKGLLNKDFDEIIKMIEVGPVPESDARKGRSIANDTAKFAKKYKTYGSKSIQDINLDFSLKFIGSEMFFLSLGDQIPNSLEDIFKYFSSSVDSVKKQLSSFNKEFTLHDLFLDSNAIFPTGLGVPLEFNAQGLVASKVDIGMKVDIDTIIEENWLAPKYQMRLVPSVDIALAFQIGFNAYVIATGIQLESTLNSASGCDIKFDFSNEGNGFNLHIESPRSKLELITAAINPGFYVAELDKPTKHVLKKDDENQHTGNYHMCFNQLESIGLNLCIDASSILVGEEDASNAAGAFSQVHPVSINVYSEVEKTYVIRGSYVSQKKIGSQEWKIEFNTPGSNEDRTTSVEFELSSDKRRYGRLAFHSPIHNFAFESGLNDDERELLLYALYEDSDNTKRIRIGFLRTGNEYRPLIEIENKGGISNEINGYSMDGMVVLQKLGEGKAEYTFENLRITNQGKERVILNGLIGAGPAWFKNELHINVGKNSYLIKANFKVDNGVYDIGLFTNDESSPDNVYGGSALIQFTDEVFVVQLLASAASWDIDFNNKFQYTFTQGTSELTASNFQHNIVIRKKKKVMGQLKLEGLTSGNHKLELNSELMSGKRVATFSFKYDCNRDILGDYVAELHGKYNKQFVDIIAKSDLNGNRFVINNTLTTSWGTLINVKGEMGQKYTAQDIYIDVHGISQLSKKGKPVQWIVKVIGGSDKVSSEGKILRDNVDVFKYNGELQNSHDKLCVGKIALSLKNVAIVKGDFRVVKNGKGEATFGIETQTSESQHKLGVNFKFLLQAPKFEMDAIIMLDDVKQLIINTDSYLDEVKFSTKNVAEVLNKKIAFDAEITVNPDLHTGSHLQGNFVLLCPTGRVFDGNMKRKVTANVQNGNLHDNIEIQIGDTINEKKRSLIYTANTTKLNMKTREISYIAQVLLTNFDSKKLEITANVLPKGHTKSLEIWSRLRGDLFNTSSDTTLVIDQYDKKHGALFFELKFGDFCNCNLTGRYNLGSHDIPAKFEVQGNAQLTSSIREVQFNASGKLLNPKSEIGTYVLELHVDEHDGDSQFFYGNTILKGSKGQVVWALDWETKDMHAPLKLEALFQNAHEYILNGSSNIKQSYSLNLNYATKFFITVADLSYIGFDKADVHYKLNSSFGSTKNVDVGVRLQKIEPKTFEITWQAKSNDVEYSSDARIYQSESKKGFDLHVITPKSPIVIMGIFEISGEHKSKLLLEIENLLDLDLLYHAEFLYKAIEDFYIKSKWNSAKLNLQNYDLDIHSQDKSVVFNMKHALGVIFNGSATYSHKKENRTSIIEAQSLVEFNGKPQKAYFRLINQIYDLKIDKETGFSYILDGTFGLKKGVSSLKITNKDFDAKLSICEEKKQCTNVQVQSIVYTNIRNAMESPQHSLLIVIDLRELGYPYEFEFQSKTIRKGWKLQYSLVSQLISINNLKYKLVANIMPTNSNFEFKMPKRHLWLEVKYEFPAQDTFFGHYENSILLYFDKANNPNEVACFKAVADITKTELAVLNLNSEIKFEHPAIRTLTVSGKLDVNQYEKMIHSEIVWDIFCLPDQKVIGSISMQCITEAHVFNFTTVESLRSTGLDFNYEFSGHAGFNIDPLIFSASAILHNGASDLAVANIYASNKNTEVSIYVANEQILVVTTMFNREQYAVEINSKLQLLRQPPIAIIANLHPTQCRLNLKQKGLIDLNADMKVGKEFKLNFQGIDKPLLNARIALDASNFLQTTYTSNSDDITSFLTTVEVMIKSDTDSTVQKIKNKFKNILETSNDKEKLLIYCTTCLSKLKTSYEANINQIALELESDPILKQINEGYQKINSMVVEIYGDFAEGVAILIESLHKSLSGFCKSLQKIFSETVLPPLQNLIDTYSKVLDDLRVHIVYISSTILQRSFNALEQYVPVFKSYVRIISQALKPINEGGLELVKIVGGVIEQFFQEIREWLAKLPTVETLQTDLKERVKKIRVAENALVLINILLDKLNVLPLTPEFGVFVDKLRVYAEALLTNSRIDNEQITRELGNLFLNAVNSIWSNLDLTSSMKYPTNILASIFEVTLDSLKVFDHFSFLLSFRFSVFNFLINEHWESIFAENRIKTWVLFQNFNLRGHIADGHQLVSFDGNHYSFPGSCKYILAQDSVDNNFTIIAQLNNGKLKAITLADRDGSYAEITDSGVLKISGNQVEYPQHVQGIHVWRLFHTVWMYSEYGVEVMCTLDLRVCQVEVNGFYTSKTRGLLGNGNAEPYDDFLQADGTIAADYSTLGNGYAIGKCPSAKLKETEPIPRSELCSQIFGLESPLISGYLFENATPYRDRCDTAVAEATDKDKELVACTIATAYGLALKHKNIPTRLPSRCLKCSGSVGQRELGKKFTVKTSANKADIVFVVDLGLDPIILSKLVAPIILEIRDSLRLRGFNDVQIGVIAYNESQLYPAILTSDGGKTNYNGNITTVKFNGPKNFCIHCASQEVADPKVVEILKNIEFFLRSIIPQSDEKAFRLAFNFPFRAGAAKSIVGVRSRTSELINLLNLFRAHLTDTASTFNGALFHLIGPVKELSVEGIPRDKVVGFNSRLIATLDGKDAKKRQKLHIEKDLGIEFVLKNGGWVFTTQNFHQLKPNEQKKHFNQIVNTLADTLFRTEIVAECECEALYGLYAQHQCNIITSNFLPNKKLKTN